MPSPTDKAKLTGDTHLPDIDDGDDAPEAANDADQRSSGEIKDKEAKTSNSYGNTRDSGERPDMSEKE